MPPDGSTDFPDEVIIAPSNNIPRSSQALGQLISILGMLLKFLS
jgi:hypothetical protein